MNVFANEFLSETCSGQIAKAKAERLWNICRKYSKFNQDDLGTYRNMYKKSLKNVPAMVQSWKVLDKTTDEWVTGKGLEYPRKKFRNSRRYQLDELWTRVRLKDIIKFHLSIHRRSRDNFMTNGKIDYSKVKLVFSCDGIPCGKSSHFDLYLMTVRIVGCRNIYILNSRHARLKFPKKLKDFLKEFVEDANDLGVKVLKFLGDAPVRSLFKRIKGHSGKNSCEVCEGKGTLIRRHYFFPCSTMGKKLRTNKRWRKQVKQRHATGEDNIKGIMGKSPLLNLKKFHIIKDSPSDSLHRDHLGVTRATWKIVTNIKKGSEVRFRNVKKFTKDVNAAYCRVRLPSEYSRTSRPVDAVLFKGNEWKSLMFTAFPALLKASKKYHNRDVARIFAVYAFLLRVYASPPHVYKAMKKPWLRRLHKEFYQLYEKAFGKSSCAFNIHSFYHMDIARKSGRLPETSTEQFEALYAMVLQSYCKSATAIGKQFMEKMYLRYLRHTEDHCERKLKFNIHRKHEKVDDSLVVDENWNFFKVLHVQGDNVRVVKIVTKKWKCPNHHDLPFHKVGVFKFVKLDNTEMTICKDMFTGKAALYNKKLLMGMQKDCLFS